MDYRYIEQLLDRYWECETSLEEENILRSFFAQKDVPVSLLHYRDFFVGQKAHREEQLGEDFDLRILALTEGARQEKQDKMVKAVRLTRSYRLRPFFQAAACIAMVLCLGMAAEMAAIREDASANLAADEQPVKESPNASQTAYENGELIQYVDSSQLVPVSKQ